MRIEATASGLVVETKEPLDGAVQALLDRDLDGIAAALGAWGRFTRPVRLRTTTDQSELQAAAPCVTLLHLTGVANLDGVVLLAPGRWTVPPGPRVLEQALLHELAHVLLFQRCAPPGAETAAYVPTWFREGMATVIAEGPPLPNRRRDLGLHPQLAELPGASDAVMATHPDACYLTAALLFQAWMDRFGAVGLTGLCRAMRAGHNFAAAHERACAMTETTWIAAWVQAVRVEARQG